MSDLDKLAVFIQRVPDAILNSALSNDGGFACRIEPFSFR